MSDKEQRVIFWFAVLLTALIVLGTWFIVFKMPEWFKEERREIPTQPVVEPERDPISSEEGKG